ncbi:MAG: hypothetical protein LBT84_07615 [Spirochaetia bacterium]|jgi:hypothetical protein|nr:hypothetical protein [Spirochaetia bacterium]
MACDNTTDSIESIKVTVKVMKDSASEYVTHEIKKEDWPIILNTIENMVYDEKQHSEKNPHGYMLKMAEPTYKVEIHYKENNAVKTMLVWGGGRVKFNGKWYHIKNSYTLTTLLENKTITLNPNEENDVGKLTDLKGFDEHFVYMSDENILLEKPTLKPYTGKITAIHNKDYREELNYENGYLSGWQVIYFGGHYTTFRVQKAIKADNNEILEYRSDDNILDIFEYYNYYENGKLWFSRTKEGKNNYKEVYHYKTGAKEKEGHTEYMHLETDYGAEIGNEYVKTGHWIHYHENGQIASEGEYGSAIRLNGETGSIKIWKYYNEKGELIETKDYGSRGEKR